MSVVSWLNTTADKMAPDRYMVWNELISNYEWNVPTLLKKVVLKGQLTKKATSQPST